VSALLEGPLCTCDLALVLGVSDSAVSHQLRLLKDLQLVVSRRDGRIVYHDLAGPHVRRFVESICERAREVRRAS
jgi:DNA-binding transcriptional ArsR family regulator